MMPCSLGIHLLLGAGILAVQDSFFRAEPERGALIPVEWLEEDPPITPDQRPDDTPRASITLLARPSFRDPHASVGGATMRRQMREAVILGSLTVNSAPVDPLDAAPPDIPRPIVESAPVEPVPVQPTAPLIAQLEQAMTAERWSEAIETVDQLMLVAPNHHEQLKTYRSRLEEWQALSDQAEQLLSQPSPLPSQSLTPDPPDLDPPDPVAAVPPPPLPARIPATPNTQEPQTLGDPSTGSGGMTAAGVAASAQENLEPIVESPQPATQQDMDWGSYLSQLQREVLAHWQIQGAGQSHTTRLQLTLARAGTIEGIQVLDPSGDALVDAAVVSAIRQAAPFDPLPEGYERFVFELDVLSGAIQVQPSVWQE
ncbi:MAG: TonB C-terminal domain-containing protein [Synechococcaceae cyanobacterium SM2_3_2]|nr:TonB C-terminal domain-containing protein [Synechococcaceae cyanobacterium SM2_3_2]